MEYKGISIEWLHHDCFVIKGAGVTIFTDPYMVKEKYNSADMVLVTHDHYDHLDVDSIKKVAKKSTVLVAPRDCAEKLSGLGMETIPVKPDEVKIIRNVTIRTVMSYNTNKFRAQGEVFHPKEKGNVGYVFMVGNVKFYITGDTDFIPEMSRIKADVALLPVSGTYVMTPEEAAEAAKTIKAELTIPMHYGSGIGTVEEARKFSKLVPKGMRVEILDSIE